MGKIWSTYLKYRYSEKAAQIWKNCPTFFELIKVFFQLCVAFSEYLNLKNDPLQLHQTYLKNTDIFQFIYVRIKSKKVEPSSTSKILFEWNWGWQNCKSFKKKKYVSYRQHPVRKFEILSCKMMDF